MPEKKKYALSDILFPLLLDFVPPDDRKKSHPPGDEQDIDAAKG
jgi:hypothetical protein